jgi:hypothetical protein
MKSFTNLKTIDEIMYIVDGLGGNNSYIRGKGGLGYKPYYMSGGMIIEKNDKGEITNIRQYNDKELEDISRNNDLNDDKKIVKSHFDYFNDNKDIFQLAYQENSEKGIHLWTHAGVTREWLRDTKREIFSPKYRLYPIIEEYENSDIADLLNILWEIRNDRIFNIDSHSGGFDLWAGPIWVRPDILNHFHIEGVNQIVGHTPHKALRIDELVNSKHYYVDRLFGKDDEVLILDL